jgi:uncharacterized protein YhaN
VRIERLELRAFGPFTGVTLELGGADAGLHLIHGRNEAGKSTTLRALKGLLFGIPHITQDAHVHPPPDLRIGAVLQDGTGRRLAIIRRKGRKNDLMDMDTEAPLDPSLLTGVLGGVDQQLFDAMYGLDHESLRCGGEALLRGEGEVGSSLLEAGMGGRGIHDVLTRLESEADRIFLPHGKNPLLNQALRELTGAKKTVRQGEVSADAWHAQKDAIEAARAELHGLDAERRRVAEEKYRLERIRDVLGPLQELRALREERGRIGAVPELSDDDMAQRAEAERVGEDAAREVKRLADEVAKLEDRLGSLREPEVLAEVSEEAIQDLADRLGSHRRSLDEQPELTARLRHVEEEMRALLARVRPGGDSDAIDAVGMRSGLAERVRELANERSGLEGSLDQARSVLTSVVGKRRAAEARLREAVELAPAVDLEMVPVPGEATMDRFVAEFAELADGHRRLREEETALVEQRADTDRQLDAERRQGDVPDEAQLAHARADRDALWARIRDGERDAAIAQGFERAMVQADEVADRLRREAARVATHARLWADREALVGRMERLESRRRELHALGEDLRGRWNAAWDATGIHPMEPPAMLEWRKALEDVRGLLGDEREAAAQAERCETALEAWRARWGSCMEELGLPANAAAAEAEAVLEDLRTLLAKREAAGELRRRIEAMDRDRKAFEARVEGLARDRTPDLAEGPLEDRADALVRRWHRAQSERDERVLREKDLQAARGRLDEARRRSAWATEVLDGLMAQVGAADLQALRDAEARLCHARDLDARIRDVEERILRRGEGATVDELAEQARDREASEVRARVDELEGHMEALDRRRTEAAQRMGSTEAGLQVLEGRSAASAAEEVAEALARVKAHAHRHVRLRLAAVLLRRELERYRDQHQGPVLQRAGPLFARLTLGSYTRLKAGYGSDDDRVLVCVRADGREVGTPGLSDGTRDQLYLALRMATIEHNASSGDPLPFVLDDVFVHFDDERTRAGLAALGDLAASTQVLLFTHHARLVELARDAVPAERLCVHDLDDLRGTHPTMSTAASEAAQGGSR